MLYDLAELKETDLGKIDGYEISADGKKMLVRKDRRLRHHRPPQSADQARSEARPLRDGDGPRPAPGMGPDLRGMLAADEGVLLRPEHARRRLGRPPAALQAAGRGGQPPGRPDLRHRRAHRRAQRRPHLRRRRRHAGRAEGQGRDARGQVRARRQDRLFQDRQDPQGPELGPRPALAPDRDRRQRQGRGVPRRRQRPAPRQGRRPRRAPLQQGRKQVTLKVSAAPDGKGDPRRRRRPHRDGERPLLPRLGRGQHRQGRQGHGRQGRLHPHPEHGRRGPERVRQALLSPAAQEGPDHRRPRQRRRQRLAA